MDNAVTMLPDQGHAHGMDYRIDFRPTAAVATLTLPPGHTVRAESGAMVSMGGDVTLDSSMEGGLWGAVKRTAGGRSGFVSRFSGPGELALAPPAPGDVVPVELSGRPCAIAAHGYLASSEGVDIETGWGGAKSFFASDSAFVLRASGIGVVLLSAFGALVHRTPRPRRAPPRRHRAPHRLARRLPLHHAQGDPEPVPVADLGRRPGRRIHRSRRPPAPDPRPARFRRRADAPPAEAAERRLKAPPGRGTTPAAWRTDRRDRGLLLGHQRGPHLATREDHDLATSGDFVMATDRRRTRSETA